MRKTPLILVASAMAIVGAGAIIAPAANKAPVETRALEGTHIVTWNALKDGVKKASDGQVFILDNDIRSSGDSSDRIKIDGKHNITIDLNGHNVDRNRTKASSDGHAFEIQGDSTVTLTNTSDSPACIGGGYAENGGGINIHDGSSVTVNNITFYRNKASNDGGAIQTKGTLIVNNCIFRENKSEDDGGAIYACGDSRIEIKGSTFVENVAENDGGAVDAQPDYDSEIRNCTFTQNRSKTEDGGALSIDTDKVLSVYDCYFSHNECEDDGGAINLEDGTLRLYGTSIIGNKADDGGAIYCDSTMEICDYVNPTTIENNSASSDGGAIYNDHSDVTIGAATIRNNTAKSAGGAMRLKGGKTNLNGTVFLGNKASLSSGGAISMGSDATLNINGGEYTDNMATGLGGAVYYDRDAKSLTMKGAITMYENSAANGTNLYLDKKNVIKVVGSLEGSTIGVGKYDFTGTITKDYSEHNSVAPTDYFFASNGYSVYLTGGGEVEIQEGSSGGGGVTPVEPVDPYNLYAFVGDGNKITRDTDRLGGNNWMSGISGSRYLNEINIPGTHDTAMRSIGTEAGAASAGGYAGIYAITQYRYIPEQYEEGVRYVDIRLNNRVVTKENLLKSYKIEDDGEHLWQVHGKKGGGTYWAEDADGNLIHLGMVLDWTREFLERNPSETIIMGFSDETYYDEYIPTIYKRLLKILTEYEQEHPGIFYLENNDLTARYSSMPRLSDVRGKIAIEVDAGHGVGGFHSYSDYVHTAGQKTDYHVSWDDKVDDVNKFFKDESHQLSVPKDGGAWEHEGTMFKIGLNCAPQTWFGIPWFTPTYHSDRVIDRLFYREGGAFYDIQGKYVGWVKTDGATEREWGKIWRANFVQEDEDYVTVTVDPNLDDERYQIKQYSLMANTPITVPSFNYDYNEEAGGLYFLGWKVGEQTYFPGAEVVVTENMTFTAAWTETTQITDTVVKVVFQDCDNVDGLRPNQLDLTINGTAPVTVTSDADWTYVYGGKISSIVPNWDLIKGEGKGTDAADSYRYEVTGDTASGFTLTLIHTNTSIMVQYEDLDAVRGVITWNDDGDWDKVRPLTSMVQVGLAPVGTEDYVQSTLSTPCVSGDGNTWDYIITNTSVPKYHDGVEAQYEVGLKISDTWMHSLRYQFDQDGFDFSAFTTAKKTFIGVRVRWADNENPARPESVKVHFLGDDHEISVATISGTSNSWMSFHLVNFYHKAVEYAPDNVRVPYENYNIAITDEAGNPISGYDTPIITQNDKFFDVLFMKEGVDLTNVDDVIAKIDALGEVEYTPEYKANLDAARASYEALDSVEQSLVTNLDILQNREMEYAEKFGHLIDIDARILDVCSTYMTLPCSEMRDVFRDLVSDVLSLSDEDRNSLWYADQLNAAIINIGHIEHVYELIEKLGDATLTDEFKAELDAAKAAYDALTDEQKACIDNYHDLALAEADYFAKRFIAATDPVCGSGSEADDHSAGLNTVWSDLSLAWDGLSDEAKAILKEGIAEDAIEDFYARYSHIVGRYGQDYVFADGPVVQQVGYYSASSSTSATMPIALACVLAASVLATGALLLVRRKRTR